MITWYAELAHQMALVPVLVAGWMWLHDRPVDRVVLVFLVAWLADWVTHWGAQWMVAALYPAVQALVVVRGWRWGMVVMMASGSSLAFGGSGPELFARTVAWGSILAHDRRRSLLVYFGLGLLAWAWYAVVPGWSSWSAYQAIRAVGIGMYTVTMIRREG